MESQPTTTEVSPATVAQTPKTPGQRAREEYLRRAEASHKEREDIFRRNGLLREGESLPRDTQAINARCCGK